jgi:heme iron utilization protein
MSADRAAEPPAPVSVARRLMRLARTAALATLSPETGAPLSTLVGVASDEDGAPLLLLSSLAAHSKNLANDARASILIGAPALRGDPLNVARVTLNGRLERADTARRRERYLQRNPKSKLMMGLRDFQIFRLDIATVHYNGGFGLAGPMTRDDVLLPGDVAALVVAEANLLAEAQTQSAALAHRLGLREAGVSPRAIGLDAAGLDLTVRGKPSRIDWPELAATPEAWRAQLATLRIG